LPNYRISSVAKGYGNLLKFPLSVHAMFYEETASIIREAAIGTFLSSVFQIRMAAVSR
jgi:hypothetical protein